MKTHRQLQNIPAPIIRRVIGLAFATAAICLPLTAFAAVSDYFVGTCKPGSAAFTTIMQAVSAVPAGSIINVCPGTYPEQVVIEKSLTLQGVQSGNSGSATISAPPAQNLFEYQGDGGVAIPQVWVQSFSGPVNITGIVVDAAGVASLPYMFPAVVSILYESTSGTIDHVVIQNLSQGFTTGNDTGTTRITGIVIADDLSLSPTVTVKNSVVNMPADGLTEEGIYLPSSAAPAGDNITLNVTNTSLLLNGTAGQACGIDDETGTGTFSGNTISALSAGILVANGSFTISDNTITGALPAVQDNGTTATAITDNTLVSNGIGISSNDPNVTIKDNRFYDSAPDTYYVGINFNCTSPAAISGNTFMGAPVALYNVPAGASLKGTAGSYFGVPTIELLCAN